MLTKNELEEIRAAERKYATLLADRVFGCDECGAYCAYCNDDLGDVSTDDQKNICAACIDAWIEEQV